MLASTPVVIGVATITERDDDPTQCREAIDLMAEVVRAAARDAGAPGCLAGLDEVLVPLGTWSYGDAPGEVARLVGAEDAHGVLGELGVLQTSLLHRAVIDVAAGRADLVAVVGAESKFRTLRARVAGLDLADRDVPGEPAERLRSAELVISRLEIDHGLVQAVQQYALVENALGAAEGQDVTSHTDAIAELWARFSDVARTQAGAWNPEPMTREAIRDPAPDNRRLASPYNKWHNSQWNVNQGAAILVASAAKAESIGVPRDRWVFPHAGADSDAVVPVTERAVLHRCEGAGLVANVALGHVRLAVDELAAIDLYSCFPVAVRIQACEIGIEDGATPTITGGMAFYGGPFNNYVLQSSVLMVERVRERGEPGAVSAVSGMLTKQGFSVFGPAPSVTWRHHDVTGDVLARTGRVTACHCDSGRGTIVSTTLLHGRQGPERRIAIVDLDDATRTLVDLVDHGGRLATGPDDLSLIGATVRISAEGARVESS